MPPDPRDITPQGLPVGWYDATKDGSNFSLGCLKYVFIAAAVFFSIIVLTDTLGSPNPVTSRQQDELPAPAPAPNEETTEYTRKETRDLSAGDCYSNEISPKTVILQTCAESHDGEVVGIATLKEGVFPAGGVSDQRAAAACGAHFSTGIRRRLSDESLMFNSSRPGEEEWNAGDRSIVCMIERGFHEAPLVGRLS
jgi:Septum formation